MLVIDGVSGLDVRGELIVGLIVEVQPSECSDAWIRLRNVADKIFEIQSQAADVVEQE